MIGKHDEIRTQVVFDHISAFRSASRTETQRSLSASPFDAPQRQQAVEMSARNAGGDEAALAAFYQRFAPLLYGIALKIMKDEKDAEDDQLIDGALHMGGRNTLSVPVRFGVSPD
jgi:hypothetical protein